MNSDTLAQTADRATKQRNMAIAAVFLALIAIVFLAYTVANKDVVVRMVPTLGGEAMTVGQSSANNVYLETVSRELVKVWGDATAKTKNYTTDVMLRYVCPEYEGSMKQEIYNRWEDINRYNLTTVFFGKSVKVKPKELAAEVVGRLNTYVGEERTSTASLQFNIQYEINNGQICFSSFVGEEK